MKDYVEVNEKNCDEVHNCMCVKEINGKTYCLGCGNVQNRRIKNDYYRNGEIIETYWNVNFLRRCL